MPFESMGYRSRALRVAAITAALAGVAGPASAGEAGTAVKADEIKAAPFTDAKKVGALATGDRVDIQKKDGGWYQVKSGRGNGWVRMLSIRRGDAKAASGGAGGLLGLASGRAGTGKVVATTGIRGLSEEELKTAKFNPDELRRLDAYTVSRADAKKFAAGGQLAARRVDELPAPSGQ